MLRRARTVAIAITFAGSIAALSAHAQPQGSPPPPGVSAAEWEEIQKALGADSAERRATGPIPAPVAPTASAPAAAAGRGLQSLNPDIAFILDTTLAYFSDDAPLQTGAHDPTKTGFNLQQFEGSISGAVDPYFRFDSFLVFSQFGVEIEEAFATSLALPGNLQLRVGQFLTRFGRLNSTHPHAWDFADQPFAIGRIFGAEASRGLGVEVSYLTPLPWYAEVIASSTDAAGEATARSFYGATDLGVRGPFDTQVTLAFKQFFAISDDLGLSLGLSGAGGPNATGHGNRSEVYGLDLYLKYRPLGQGGFTTLALQSEWFYRRRQVPRDVLSDLSSYTYLLWRFAQRWSTAFRYEIGTPVYGQAGGRVPDDLDPYWTGFRHRLTAAATFLPTEFSRVRLQVSSDVPGWRPDPIWAVFVATEFLVGAHGSHKY